ncbi:DNA-binding protein [Wenzhouxiangella sp. AB-CW3]|uniref:DNA-binding protein n=1 Tax=Wenzhouxiangella sp. AB-CW3 TaxID=2771012 RepID=UPI00168B9349|nr:DNA-binding protein [Wenzhouxiangella sp. AB-CW3]QOC23772.1 DNA-binding protein [Wenzhouxiangella sp. AB-CW3]
MTLENLVGSTLHREQATDEEIDRLREKAAIRLDDAQNEQISRESRFDLAYEALLQFGLAALRANHYRPSSSGGHHMTVLQTLPKTIGFPKEKVRLIDQFRRQRALGLYDGSFDPTAAELNELIDTAKELQKYLNNWLESQPRT